MSIAGKVAVRWAALWCLSFAAPGSLAQTPGTWVIDSGASEVHWRVYKAGSFARLGHNHVIAIAQPTGTVKMTSNLSGAAVALEFSVADLSIDDPDLRARYGEGFASEPTEKDIAGTRKNMLGRRALNGRLYPVISLTGTGLSGKGADQTIELSIALLGRTVALTVPINVTFDGDELRAQSDFRLLHEDLGMDTFSVMMGALQVAPEIDFHVDIRAMRSGASDVAL